MFNSFKKFFDGVVMPPRTDRAVIERGVALVKSVVDEEQRRLAETAAATLGKKVEAGSRLSVLSDICFSNVIRDDGDASPVKWRKCHSAPLPDFTPPPRKKPDFHAACLSFPARLLTYVREKCGGDGRIAYTRAGVSRQIYSRITAWDDENADKKTVMKFCIGLQLEMAEAERLMKSAGYAFSNTLPLDRAFTYAIENRMWNIADVDELLKRNHLPDLGLHF